MQFSGLLQTIFIKYLTVHLRQVFIEKNELATARGRRRGEIAVICDWWVASGQHFLNQVNFAQRMFSKFV
jgi:hypothetical protein